MFGYSDEDGTDAAGFDDKLAAEVIAARVERVTALAEELMSQRAEDRVGTRVEVLVEETGDDVVGRARAPGPGRRRHDPAGRRDGRGRARASSCRPS